MILFTALGVFSLHFVFQKQSVGKKFISANDLLFKVLQTTERKARNIFSRRAIFASQNFRRLKINIIIKNNLLLSESYNSVFYLRTRIL